MGDQYCRGFCKWEIWVKSPIYDPPRIRFHWGDQTWAEKPGDNYTITYLTPLPTLFRVWYWQYPSAKKFYNLLPMPPDITSWSITKPEAYWNFGYYFSHNHTLYTNSLWDHYFYLGQYWPPFVGGYAAQYNPEKYTGKSHSILNAFDNSWFTEVEVIQAGRMPGYLLKIFSGNELNYQEIGENSPIVEAFGSSDCDYGDGELDLLISGENLAPNQWLEVEEVNRYQSPLIGDGRGYHFFRKTLISEGNILTTSVGYVASPSNCDNLPRYEISCAPLEENNKRKCPDNSCPKICGDSVCCYNSLGVAVDKIPLLEYDDG